MNIDIPEDHQRFLVYVVAHLREQLPSAILACASAMPHVVTPLTISALVDAGSAALTDLMYAQHASEGAARQVAWLAQHSMETSE